MNLRGQKWLRFKQSKVLAWSSDETIERKRIYGHSTNTSSHKDPTIYSVWDSGYSCITEDKLNDRNLKYKVESPRGENVGATKRSVESDLKNLGCKL